MEDWLISVGYVFINEGLEEREARLTCARVVLAKFGRDVTEIRRGEGVMGTRCEVEFTATVSAEDALKHRLFDSALNKSRPDGCEAAWVLRLK